MEDRIRTANKIREFTQQNSQNNHPQQQYQQPRNDFYKSDSTPAPKSTKQRHVLSDFERDMSKSGFKSKRELENDVIDEEDRKLAQEHATKIKSWTPSTLEERAFHERKARQRKWEKMAKEARNAMKLDRDKIKKAYDLEIYSESHKKAIDQAWRNAVNNANLATISQTCTHYYGSFPNSFQIMQCMQMVTLLNNDNFDDFNTDDLRYLSVFPEFYQKIKTIFQDYRNWEKTEYLPQLRDQTGNDDHRRQVEKKHLTDEDRKNYDVFKKHLEEKYAKRYKQLRFGIWFWEKTAGRLTSEKSSRQKLQQEEETEKKELEKGFYDQIRDHYRLEQAEEKLKQKTKELEETKEILAKIELKIEEAEAKRLKAEEKERLKKIKNVEIKKKRAVQERFKQIGYEFTSDKHALERLKYLYLKPVLNLFTHTLQSFSDAYKNKKKAHGNQSSDNISKQPEKSYEQADSKVTMPKSYTLADTEIIIVPDHPDLNALLDNPAQSVDFIKTDRTDNFLTQIGIDPNEFNNFKGGNAKQCEFHKKLSKAIENAASLGIEVAPHVREMQQELFKVAYNLNTQSYTEIAQDLLELCNPRTLGLALGKELADTALYPLEYIKRHLNEMPGIAKSHLPLIERYERMQAATKDIAQTTQELAQNSFATQAKNIQENNKQLSMQERQQMLARNTIDSFVDFLLIIAAGKTFEVSGVNKALNNYRMRNGYRKRYPYYDVEICDHPRPSSTTPALLIDGATESQLPAIVENVVNQEITMVAQESVIPTRGSNSIVIHPESTSHTIPQAAVEKGLPELMADAGEKETAPNNNRDCPPSCPEKYEKLIGSTPSRRSSRSLRTSS